jgi:hypothetical protein
MHYCSPSLRLPRAVQVHDIDSAAAAPGFDVAVTTTECYTVTAHNLQGQEVERRKHLGALQYQLKQVSVWQVLRAMHHRSWHYVTPSCAALWHGA